MTVVVAVETDCAPLTWFLRHARRVFMPMEGAKRHSTRWYGVSFTVVSLRERKTAEEERRGEAWQV